MKVLTGLQCLRNLNEIPDLKEIISLLTYDMLHMR